MSKNTLLVGLVAALAAAGCTANMNANVTPTLPGASASAGATVTASAAPTGTASNTPTVGASAGATVSTGVADAAMTKIYKMGRKWVYALTTAGITVDMGQEVVKIEGATATIKTTTTTNIMGQSNTSTSESTVDLSKKDFQSVVTKQVASGNSNTSYTWQTLSTGNETITVPAGQYACMKFVGKMVASGSTTGAVNASSTADVSTTYWTNDDVGLVKVDGTSTNTASASTYTVKQMPDLSNLPGGMPAGIPSGLGSVATGGSFTYKMELKSVTP